MRTFLVSLLLVIGLLFGSFVYAGNSVYITSHGKKYHTHRDCISLKTAKVTEVDTTTQIGKAAIAERELCKICERRKAK